MRVELNISQISLSQGGMGECQDFFLWVKLLTCKTLAGSCQIIISRKNLSNLMLESSKSFFITIRKKIALVFLNVFEATVRGGRH